MSDRVLESSPTLRRFADLTPAQARGIELRPYWGVPGVDHLVRDPVDDDPELVEVLRELGRRVGIDYAHVGVVTARKRGVTRR